MNINPEKFESIESMPSQEKEPKNYMIIVVKPDAYFHVEEILKRFENEGLVVENKVTKMLPLDFVNKIMYTNIPSNIKFENAKHFSQGPSTIVLLEGGDGIMDKVIEIVGKNTSPGQCDEESIRYIFGDHLGENMPGGNKYYRNAIHRGKDENEVRDDFSKFSTFFVG